MCNFCSTILEEEKLQQEERLRMEMRRQVTVSWDSGGSDEAPPKVRLKELTSLWSYCISVKVFAVADKQTNRYLSVCSPVDQVTPVLVPVKASSPAPNSTISRYSKHTHTHIQNTHTQTCTQLPLWTTVLLCSFSSIVAAAAFSSAFQRFYSPDSKKSYKSVWNKLTVFTDNGFQSVPEHM